MGRNETTALRRRVSMNDVAAHAGVSQKTVSRVVNGEPHVREEIQRRVRASIKELGFRPNAAARSLVTRRTKRVGVVAFGSAIYGPRAVLSSVESVARADGYALSVLRTETTSPREVQAAVDSLLDEGVEGIVLYEPLNLGDGVLEVAEHIAVLTIGSLGLTGRPDELVIGVDEFDGGRQATQHLLDLGHSTVHHIAGPAGWIASERRSSGWRDALTHAGIRPPDVVAGDWSPRSGFEAMTALLDDTECTAVFVANDHMAIGAISAIEQSGRAVPGDISVVGFDDLDIAPYLSTPLTTMRQEFDAFARLGMDLLIRAIDGNPPSVVHELVPTSLEIRATSGPSPRP